MAYRIAAPTRAASGRPTRAAVRRGRRPARARPRCGSYWLAIWAMTTPLFTAISSAKMIVRRENDRLALDIVVFAFNQGRWRLRMLLLQRSPETCRTEAVRFVDRRQARLLVAPTAGLTSSSPAVKRRAASDTGRLRPFWRRVQSRNFHSNHSNAARRRQVCVPNSFHRYCNQWLAASDMQLSPVKRCIDQRETTGSNSIKDSSRKSASLGSLERCYSIAVKLFASAIASTRVRSCLPMTTAKKWNQNWNQCLNERGTNANRGVKKFRKFNGRGDRI